MIPYFDCAATAPLDPEVREVLLRYLDVDFGNSGSRTHEYGVRAKRAVQEAKEKIAAVADAFPEEIVITSGATESNNLAILGLSAYGMQCGKRHIVTTAIEHKAVLEPVAHLQSLGFEITVVSPTCGGWVDPDAILAACRKDTLLVSVMHVNNETGIIQPVGDISERLLHLDTIFHVDAAQGFGKDLEPLRNRRIDMISISGHKLYAPKGVGALIARRRGKDTLPIKPLMYGGGQEKGLRPGTTPVHLIAALGAAAETATKHHAKRKTTCLQIRERALAAFSSVGAVVTGDTRRSVPHIANVSVPGLDSEAIMLALKDQIAISNGSACTSHSYELSHVLTAMGLERDTVQGAVRLSWSHLTQEPDWQEVTSRLKMLL